MGNLVKSKGNMYSWVSHEWSPGRGCSFQCTYCYVKNYGGNPATFRLETPFPTLGKQKTIFIGHMNDLFSDVVSDRDINAVLDHCKKYPFNQYVFQTKDPSRTLYFEFPEYSIIGTTIETDGGVLLRHYTEAPPPASRAVGLAKIKHKKFITIEPIMKFNIRGMLELIEIAKPSFVNIGADSKHNRLPEPSADDIQKLIDGIRAMAIDIKIKDNLKRLMVEVKE